MSHADHFLSRLDRVSLPHMELALSLYQDAELLRYILGNVTLPERAERVAIALNNGPDSPYIIVTRDGKFVTCLGEGMSPGQSPIINRAQLDAITNRLENHRDRMAAREKMFGQGGEFRHIVRRIYNRGNELSREEFMAYASWQPILSRQFFTFMVECGELAINARKALVPILKRTDKPRPGWNDKLHEYWKMSYACSHFAVLSAMGPQSAFAGEILTGTNQPVDSLISAFTMTDGIASMCFKGLYCISKIGKPLLPFYKSKYEAVDNLFQLRESVLCLMGIAARHSKLRAEIRKALSPIPPQWRPSLAKYNQAVLEIVDRAFDKPEEAELMGVVVGGALAIEMTQSQPKGSPFRFENIMEVPADIARSLSLSLKFDASKKDGSFGMVLMLASTAACAAPEDLYLPKAFIDIYREPWKPQDTLDMLESYKEEIRAPIPKSKEPSRSGPCPCGSGKKYKRCCAE
jgi:hypothetical protein